MHCIDAAYVARSVVCLCVCLLDTSVSPVKKAEAIEITFRSWLAWAQGIVLDRVEIPPWEGTIFGVVWPFEKLGIIPFAAYTAAKGIIQSSITAWQCGHAMRPSSKFLGVYLQI